MNRYVQILICCLVATAVSAQQWHTTIDVRRSAVKAFPEGVSDLLIVNNAVQQPADFGHALVMYGSQKENERIDLTQAATRTLFAATEQLDISGLFSSVGLVAKNQATGTFFQSSSLTKPQSDSLCSVYQADGSLSLDRLVIYDRKEIYLGEDYNYYAYLEVFAVSSWTLMRNNGQITTFTHADTLVWNGSSYDSSLALEQLPDRQTALLDVAEYTGEEFAKQFIPQWETVDRYMYENADSLMAAGMSHFTHRRWERALDLWQQCYDISKQGSRKQKQMLENCAYAAADLAVANEITGNLSAAVKWAKLSVEAFGKMQSADAAQQQVNMTFYLRELEQRRKDEDKLSR
ncbi:MAG: hypothetical protein IJ776_09955 [Paludibacteraceae bacterium]|nr:hypothetical protein [Paludibacteraceae bacterium]